MDYRTRTVMAIVLLPLLGGCRDGTPPFTPPDRVIDDESAYALTFGTGVERDPSWSPSGDTILYQTDALRGVITQAVGILTLIPADGRSARVLFPEAHPGRRLLATPVLSPDGQRVAYMDVMRYEFMEGPCWGGSKSLCETTQPLLDSATLRVRRLDEDGSFMSDPSVKVLFEGRTRGEKFAHLGPYYEPLYPFQAENIADRSMLFRPSWSPDGERVAYSDGLAIRVWQVGEESAAVVPGTMDGVSAAWSPDGQWIAFTRLERSDSVITMCECGVDEEFPIETTRVTYTVDARTIVLTRPDGSELIELGEGEEPAWSADNQYVFVRRDDAIVRIPVAGGAVEAVPNTARGRAPAVSPDGGRLAFARRKPNSTTDYDIWVVTLVP